MIVGVDEAGRGPLAGSVVACALYIKDETIGLPLRDSKRLSPLKRYCFFKEFQDKVIFSIGVAEPKEIDRHNILNATFIAFERAIKGLIKKKTSLKNAEFVVDGPYFNTRLPIRVRCLPRADSSIRQVAYASIVAKIFRDYLMQVADFVFPEWEFFIHKGYPTKRHYDLIKKNNLSPLHRKSFTLSHTEEE